MAEIEKFTAIYSSHQIYLERLAAGMGNDALPYIQSINDRVMKLFNNLPKKQLSPEYQKEIRKEVNAIVKEELGEMVSAMKLSQKELGGYEAEWNDEQINAEIESDINTVVPSMTQVSSVAIATPIKVGNGRYTTYGKMFSDYTRNQAERIDGVILNGFANGQTNRDIANLVEQELPSWQGGAESQARTLARTGTNHYATQSRLTYEQENDKVIIGWRSIATLDSRTSSQCASLDGEVMKSSDPNFGKFKTPRHPNCLFEDSLITSAYGITSVSKRAYKGIKVTIRSSSGNKLAVTPNHPILTTRGWVRAKDVNLSDKLFLQSCAKGIGLVDGYDNGAYPTVKDIFESVGSSSEMSSSEVPLSPPDFHGDAIDKEIAVIRSNSLLLDKGVSAFIKENCELILKGGHAGDFILSSFRSLNELIHTSFGSSDFISKALSESPSLINGSSSHPCGLLLRAISWLESARFESSRYNHWRDSELFCYRGNSNSAIEDFNDSIGVFFAKLNELSASVNTSLAERPTNAGFADTSLICNFFDAYAGGIEFDNVVDVSFSYEESCHVYNLETVDHCYAANGIINHNCRSSLVPEIDGRLKYDDSASERPTNFLVDGKKDPKRVSSKKTYYEEMKKLSASDQDIILGPSLGKAFRKMDNPDAFAKQTINQATLEPLTLEQMKKKDSQLGRILKAQER